MIVPFIIEWQRIHKFTSQWECNDNEKAKDMILKDIAGAKKRILIYGGKNDIYNALPIKEALEGALEKGVAIEMILEDEPSISTKSDVIPSANKVFLAFTNKELFKHHFRVVDYDYVYIEKPHPKGSEKRCFKRLPNTRFLPGDFSKIFHALKRQVAVE
jgi:sugar-specific transcriptional regulator TrmB